MEDKKCGGKTEIYLGQSREGRVRHQKTESKTIRTDQKRKKKRKKKNSSRIYSDKTAHTFISSVTLYSSFFIFNISSALNTLPYSTLTSQ